MTDMKTITLRLATTDYSKLNAYAKNKRMSMSALLLSLFDAELNKGSPIKGRTKRDIVMEEYATHVAEIPMFATQLDAQQWIDAIRDMRKRAGLEGDLGVQHMPIPQQAVEQVNSFYSTKPAPAAIPSEDALTPEAEAKEHSDWFNSLNK